MAILGIDTSTSCTSVALLLADGRSFTVCDLRRPGERPGHQEMLLTLADDLLGQAGIDFSAVARVAVGRGPGTFTGLRVGLATARALAQALAAEIVGVSSLEALAWRARDGAEVLLSLLDARRGELFVAAYARPVEAGAAELPRLLAPQTTAVAALSGLLDELRESTRDGRGVAASRLWLAVGDGAPIAHAAGALPEARFAAAGSEPQHVDALAICELAARRQPQALGDLLPDYCRRPDAELNLERRQAAAQVAGAIVPGTGASC